MLWKQFIHPERRLHISATIEEMHTISAFLYGSISLIGLFALLFPTWPEINHVVIATTCFIGLILSIIFYLMRKTMPLFMAVLHVPLGIGLVAYVIFAGVSAQAIGIGVVYVLSSSYAFHYLTRNIAILVVVSAMLLYAFVLASNGIVGWQAIVIFTTGCCFVMGGMVSISTKQLHHLVVRDSLTGLLNRRTVDAVINDLLVNFEKKQQSFVFVLLDLNKFKLVNDRKGHLYGDKVLKIVSAAMMKVVSQDDYVARCGGDEFVIILRNHQANSIAHLVENLKAEINGVIEFECGVSYPTSNDSLDTLIYRADEKMYLKKANRRATDKG